MQGWECPKCGCCYAPAVNSCGNFGKKEDANPYVAKSLFDRGLAGLINETYAKAYPLCSSGTGHNFEDTLFGGRICTFCGVSAAL